MGSSEAKSLLKIICPNCKQNFRKDIDYGKKNGLFSILIKDHPKSNGCSPFIAFIDENGKHRGSQKIDDMDESSAVSDEVLENARIRINEIKKSLRFYHMKMPRKEGRGFEQKVANVADRAFMSSKGYSTLINYLTENNENNMFGAIFISDDSKSNFEGGLLIYGKYLGMVFTLFWQDQSSLQSKTVEDLKGHANLAIEQLLDIYDLTDFFMF